MAAKVAKLAGLLAWVARCGQGTEPAGEMPSSRAEPARPAPAVTASASSAASAAPPASVPAPSASASASASAVATASAAPVAQRPRLRAAPPCIASLGYARWSWDRVFQIDGLEKKTAFVTLDVGLGLDTLEKVLDILAARKVRSTIFLMTDELEKAEERGVALVKRMIADGHELANHTVHHPHLTKLDDAKIEREVLGVDEWVKEHVGARTKPFFREPFLDTDARVEKILQKLCYRSVWFTVYARDDQKGVKAQEIEDAVFFEGKGSDRKERKLPNGTVLLFHGSQKENLVALPRILAKLEEQGFAFSTLGAALKTF